MPILLVTHETSRTGAPRVALQVARGLASEGHSIVVVARRPGPLLKDFQEFDCYVEPFHRVRDRLWEIRLLRPLAVILEFLVALTLIARFRPTRLYLNTASSAAYIRPGLWLRKSVILHLHESSETALHFLRPCGAIKLLSRITLVACSSAVRLSAARLSGQPASQVYLLPSVPDGDVVRRLGALPAKDLDAIDDIVIGSCGTVELRKGADLWLNAIDIVQHKSARSDVRFLWVGEIRDPTLISGRTDLFIGGASNPYPYIRRFDIMTVTSRADPFPLVVLEAMLLGTPVVAFNVGGVAEQIGEAGVVVDYGDVQSLASAVVELVKDRSRRDDLAAKARARAATMFSTETFYNSLASLMNDPDGAVKLPNGRREQQTRR